MTRGTQVKTRMRGSCSLLLPLTLGMALGLSMFYLLGFGQLSHSQIQVSHDHGASEKHHSSQSWLNLEQQICLKPQVCSHRGHLRKATPIAEDIGKTFHALRSLGVKCVDLDVFSSRDGFLLVGRETDLVGSNHSREELEEMTLSQIMALRKFPTVNEVFAEFKTIFLNLRKRKLMQPASDSPLIFIELKGSAFSENSLAFIHQQSVGAGVGESLYLWAVKEQQASLASVIAPRLALKVGISIPDRDPQSLIWGLRSIKSGVFMIAAPSLQLKPSSHASLIDTSIKRALWVVDTAADLDKAISLKSDIIISNEAEHMRNLIAKKCH